MNNEFSYLAGLVEEFFAKTRIQKSLSLIQECGIGGWEIWLQVEFAHFLSQHESEPEWHRETTLDVDRRTEKVKQSLKPDFLIRKKHWAKDTYLLLEMKQHPTASICIANMAKDVRKIEKVRKSSIALRTHWVLGVYLREPKSDIDALIYRALEACDYDYEKALTVNRIISGTPYSYCIF